MNDELYDKIIEAPNVQRVVELLRMQLIEDPENPLLKEALASVEGGVSVKYYYKCLHDDFICRDKGDHYIIYKTRVDKEQLWNDLNERIAIGKHALVKSIKEDDVLDELNSPNTAVTANV